MGRCAVCREVCCNCAVCVASKGRGDVCGPCRRAELANVKESLTVAEAAKAAKLVA